jgi:hypothetical protein
MSFQILYEGLKVFGRRTLHSQEVGLQLEARERQFSAARKLPKNDVHTFHAVGDILLPLEQAARGRLK